MHELSVYFIFNIFLFIMSGYLFARTTPDLMKKSEYVVFKTFIIAFEFYLIANTVWTLQEYDFISLPKWLFEVVCFLSLSAVLFNTLCFYKFSMIYFGYSTNANRLYEIYGVLPFVVEIILLIISLFNGMVFSVSDDMNIVHGKIYLSTAFCGFIYFAIILVSSFIKVLKSHSPIARKNCLTIFLLVVFLVAWVIIDDQFDSLTILPVAIFSVIFVLFTTFQQSSINTDALTQMNNRRKAIEYLVTQLSNVSEGNPMYLYICDINSFKDINDNFGHLEGDKALIILADSIKAAIGEVNGFAARYGGDEFILAVRPDHAEYDEKAIVARIEELVNDKCIKLKKPYNISIAAGCVRCANISTTLESYIKEADDLLYSSKRILKAKQN